MLIEAAIAAGILGAYSVWIEPRWHCVKHKTVTLKSSFPRPLEVLHLSDFHFYETSVAAVPFIQSLGGREVDLIFITGDLIDDDSGLEACMEAVSALKARHGIYAALGNHDYYHVGVGDLFHKTGSQPKEHRRHKNDIGALIQRLAEINIKTLRNENLEIVIDGNAITLIGVDDPYVFKDDLESAFLGADLNRPSFVLIHSPERHLELLKRKVDMVFSGHTHGGQIQLPWLGPVITRTTAPRRFADGLVHENGTVFHTTRGVGTGRLTPPRLNCRPEAVYFTIQFSGE